VRGNNQYEGRWEREFFDKQTKFQEPSVWQLLPLLIIPFLAAIVSLALWVFIAYLTYLGG